MCKGVRGTEESKGEREGGSQREDESTSCLKAYGFCLLGEMTYKISEDRVELRMLCRHCDLPPLGSFLESFTHA